MSLEIRLDHAGHPLRLAGLVVVSALMAASCSGRSGDTPELGPRTDAIVIGAFNFSESQVLAEVYREALERQGLAAEVLGNVGTREVMEPALEQDQVDLVPEYLGTALAFIDPIAAAETESPTEAHRRLTAAFRTRGIDVLAYAPGQNRNEVVVTEETARRFSLSEISDLAAVAGDLRFGGPPECEARPLCLQGLEERYGLEFESFVPLDTGGPLTVAALRGSEIDVGLLFTTNPAISLHGLVVLGDDRKLQPAENIVPVVRHEVVERFGAELERTLDAVTRRLTDDVLRTLNHRAEIEGTAPETIASEWLTEEGIS